MHIRSKYIWKMWFFFYNFILLLHGHLCRILRGKEFNHLNMKCWKSEVLWIFTSSTVYEHVYIDWIECSLLFCHKGKVSLVSLKNIHSTQLEAKGNNNLHKYTASKSHPTLCYYISILYCNAVFILYPWMNVSITLI